MPRAKGTAVNVKTDSTADSEPVIFVNHRNRVCDCKHRFPLFSSVLELVTAESDNAALTLCLRHKHRVRGAELESAVTNSVPVVNVFVVLLTLFIFMKCYAHEHRVCGAELESAVTNSVPVVNVFVVLLTLFIFMKCYAHEHRVHGAELESVVTNSFPVVNVFVILLTLFIFMKCYAHEL
jgi:hypothetical protein